MSEEALEIASTTLEHPSKPALPLKGEKQNYFKTMGVVVLIVGIIIANYLLFSNANSAKEKESTDTYTLATSNPISKENNDARTSEKDLIVDNQALMQQKMAEAKARDFIDRLQVPQNVNVESNGSDTNLHSTASNETNTDPILRANTPEMDNPNTVFLVRASNSKAEREFATHFGPLPLVVGQGKFIFGTLEVAINSDLPGQIRAIVSQDVYGEQGRRILIPKGSRLIGEYRSGLTNNQSRLFTVWTRIIEPNGIDIQLGSEGTDRLGHAGLTGNVDFHFFDRFGSALLVSIIGAGAANVGVNPAVDQNNSAAVYRESIAQAMGDQAKNILNQNINIPTTISVAQGEKIVVFVNRDLDFSRVYR